MKCPNCSHKNFAGEDYCVNCGSDLRGTDLPKPGSKLAKQITRAVVTSLKPPEPILLGPHDSVETAIEKMKERGYGSVLITKNDKLVGVFTERDLLIRVIGAGLDVRNTKMKKVMTKKPQFLEETAPLAYVLNKMSVENIRHIPITRDRKPVGFVSVRGMLKYFAGHSLD